MGHVISLLKTSDKGQNPTLLAWHRKLHDLAQISCPSLHPGSGTAVCSSPPPLPQTHTSPTLRALSTFTVYFCSLLCPLLPSLNKSSFTLQGPLPLSVPLRSLSKVLGWRARLQDVIVPCSHYAMKFIVLQCHWLISHPYIDHGLFD